MPGQQPSLSQRQTNPHNVSHPPSSQPSTQPKSIQEQVQDVVSEQYAVSTLDDALLCLQKPELAQQKGIIILVTLPNTNGRQVSVAPPEKGMSPEQLKPYMDAASTALSGMKSKYSVRKDDFYEGTYNQLKASYMQEVKKTPGAPDWDTFFANVKKNAHQFRCQLDDGSVVVFSQQTPKKPVPPSHPSVSLKQTKK
ncbi:hypothetical protein [Parendozoicomonas haliclonae]|uniref:hypothetical protein n=1 Tax=Parendozoicomonas haliclonae TaxID=1960125 RepID=UPI0010569223|nr:hypothetical protein [Parendozoicomonas haliclonae]